LFLTYKIGGFVAGFTWVYGLRFTTLNPKSTQCGPPVGSTFALRSSSTPGKLYSLSLSLPGSLVGERGKLQTAQTAGMDTNISFCGICRKYVNIWEMIKLSMPSNFI
jgi:hypothetical protein